jgi:hypothetical protein
MNLQLPIKLKFDPMKNEDTRRIFSHRQAKTLYLLWRFGHITNQHFNDECWRNGLRLEKIFPKNATALVNHRILASQLCGSNFNWHDSSKFAQWALPFFQNHIDIDYIVIPTKENSIDGCN